MWPVGPSEAGREEEEEEDGSFITTLRSIPSTLCWLASFALITISAPSARKPLPKPAPSLKPHFFADFFHYFLHCAFGFHGWCWQGQEPSPRPSTMAQLGRHGVGSPLLGGAPPPLLLYLLLYLLLFIYNFRVHQGREAPRSSRRHRHSPSRRQLRASGRGTETKNPLLAVREAPPQRWHPAHVTKGPPPSPSCRSHRLGRCLLWVLLEEAPGAPKTPRLMPMGLW